MLTLAGWFLPLGTVLLLAAAVPFATLAMRRRLRAVVIGAVAAGQVAFLLGGISLETNLLAVAAIGYVVGRAYRRGWRRRAAAGFAIPVVWLPVALGTLAFFAVFDESRKLTLDQLDIGTRWARSALRRAGQHDAARRADDAVRWSIDHWWLVIPAIELVVVVGVVVLARRLAVPALRRVDAAFSRPGAPAGAGIVVAAPAPADAPAGDGGARSRGDDGGGLPAPVPASLVDVVVRYPGQAGPALDHLSLTVVPGELVAVVGDNGSGKSTLARVLAGREPAAGMVERPGPVGLGRAGGAAIVFQRPESQVLGVRVADDVVWGLGAGEAGGIDVDELLTRVGLGGFAPRETATLSGGELQRLAIAAALARRPALLVSDESTAMVDPSGRRALVALLHDLAAGGMAVIHVTHHPDEAAAADRVVTMAHGRVVSDRRRGDVEPRETV